MINTWRFVVTLSIIYCFLVDVCSFLSPSAKRKSYHTPNTPAYSIHHQQIKNSIKICSTSSVDINVDTSADKGRTSVRSQVRKMTGFSWTALRATMRAATGISLTALYVSAVAVSGAWIRQLMRIILEIFPTWARYFVQPFLVMYYVPLFMLRSVTAPKRRHQKQAHDTLVESWKQSVKVAENNNSYWPIHLNENGELETNTKEIDINVAAADSVQISLEKKLENM
jgi:hypothetical protein